MVYGTFHNTYPEANIIYQPLKYTGSRIVNVDPTDPETFNGLVDGSSPYSGWFGWCNDTTIKFIFEDGSELHSVFMFGNVSRDADPPVAGYILSNMMKFAMTISAKKKPSRIETYYRPFCVKYPQDTDTGNIKDPTQNITAENFMDAAVLRGSVDVD